MVKKFKRAAKKVVLATKKVASKAKSTAKAATKAVTQTAKKVATAVKSIDVKQTISTAVDFIPIVGNVKAAYEVVVGKDPFTGKKLAPWERAVSAAAIVGGPAVKGAKHAAKIGGAAVSGIAKAGKKGVPTKAPAAPPKATKPPAKPTETKKPSKSTPTVAAKPKATPAPTKATKPPAKATGTKAPSKSQPVAAKPKATPAPVKSTKPPAKVTETKVPSKSTQPIASKPRAEVTSKKSTESVTPNVPRNSPENISKKQTINNIEEAHQWGSKNYDSWLNSLTESEKNAIRQYTGNDYSKINSYLRGQSRSLDGVDPKVITDIKTGLGKAKVPHDMQAYRGTDLRPFESIIDISEDGKYYFESLIGKTIKDNGFVSTAIVKESSFDHLNVSWVINVPKGTNAAYVSKISHYPDEAELLFNVGQEMIIKNVKHDSGGNIQVILDVI
ncbi:ADP-ribosyltransferase [Lysinibacillus sphaericus]|uniref:ADP-ribosyltransferase n=1 Tax=Lysinibacillus sphaericus TaxID=1421 RepID=UPI003F7ABB16